MKTLILSVVASIFMMAAASTAMAGTMSSSYHGLGAIDSTGVSVVSVATPSSPISLASTDRIYLDSNMVWGVDNIRHIEFGAALAGKMEEPKLYCFDFVHRFCANPL